MKKQIFQKYGRKWINTYYECNKYIILNIHKSETNENYDVLIDKEDFNKVSKGQWFVYNKRKNSKLKNIYSVLWTKTVNGKKNNYEIYQYILNTKNKNIIIDHINMNRLDNRKINLRIATSKTNRINQNPKCYYIKNGLYYTSININKINIESDGYKTVDECIIKYVQANILNNTYNSYFIKNKINEYNISLDINTYDYTDSFLNNIKLIINNNILSSSYNTSKIKRNLESLGYYFDKSTNKYLVRITVGGKLINIGRYKTEKEAQDMYLKACLLIGYDKESAYIKNMINQLNIQLNEEDYKNKYIIKIKNILDNKIEENKLLNGRFNFEYLNNINIINKLVDKYGYKWSKISKYLIDNDYMKVANASSIKKYYFEYKDMQIVL